jgi:2-keto-4-pentenoate hydratase
MPETRVPVDYASIVEILDRAERERLAIPPLTDTYPGLSVQDAYAVQAATLRRKLGDGQTRLIGRKVGLTAKAMQEQLGVNEPDFGFLLNTMLVASGGTLSRATLLQPRVEPEIAFYLARDLRGPGLTSQDVLAATRGVAPALEIVDSRIKDWKIKLADTIADNGSSARAVVGAEVPLGDLDLAAVSVTLSRNSEPAGTGTGAAVLGHPAEAVAWLANALAAFGDDDILRAGQLVLPGAMCASVFAHQGDQFVAQFEGLGQVSVHFR